MTPLSPTNTPFQKLGGESAVRALVEKFYDVMSDNEPELTRLHRCDETGRVDRESRDKFGLFLIGWLGGPQDYVARYGHPRLRMRHANVAVDEAMRDAWMRSMRAAINELVRDDELRSFLDEKLWALADFMRNRPG